MPALVLDWMIGLRVRVGYHYKKKANVINLVMEQVRKALHLDLASLIT